MGGLRQRGVPPYGACLGLLAALLILLSGCATTGAVPAGSAVIRAKDRVAPALVHIRPVKEVYTQGRREEMLSIGSGFIFSPDGYVITNEHVAGESNFVHVVLSDKREVEARVVGVDPYTDVAVLKLDTPGPLPYVQLGNSAGLESGEAVLALGSPHGLARSVSQGIISVTDRHLPDRGTMVSPFNNWLQTDAAINPGNSGGPLVNLRGEVVGVNARGMRGADNVGFAIPIDVVKEVVAEILEHGHVPRATVGLHLQEMLAMTDDPGLEGVLIADVDPVSPALESDIRAGDLLLAVNGTPVNARFQEDLPQVRKLMADLPVGVEASLSIARAGELHEFVLVPEELSQIKGSEREFTEWAFTVSELTQEQARRAGLPARRGVLVSGAQVGGIASQAGLEQGDVILEVDGAPVETLARFSEIYEEKRAQAQRLVMLFVQRGAITRFVLIKQTEEPAMLISPDDAGGLDGPGEPLHVE